MASTLAAMQARLAELNKENSTLASNTNTKLRMKQPLKSSKKKVESTNKKRAPTSKKVPAAKAKADPKKMSATRSNKSKKTEATDETVDFCSLLMTKPVDVDVTGAAFAAPPNTTGDETEEHLEANWYNGNSSAEETSDDEAEISLYSDESDDGQNDNDEEEDDESFYFLPDGTPSRKAQNDYTSDDTESEDSAWESEEAEEENNHQRQIFGAEVEDTAMVQVETCICSLSAMTLGSTKITQNGVREGASTVDAPQSVGTSILAAAPPPPGPTVCTDSMKWAHSLCEQLSNALCKGEMAIEDDREDEYQLQIGLLKLQEKEHKFTCSGHGWHEGLGLREDILVLVEITKETRECMVKYSGPEEVFVGRLNAMQIQGDIFVGSGREEADEEVVIEIADNAEKLGNFSICTSNK